MYLSKRQDELFRELDTALCEAFTKADSLEMTLDGDARKAMVAIRRRVELAMHHAIQIKVEASDDIEAEEQMESEHFDRNGDQIKPFPHQIPVPDYPEGEES